jgi:SNF2 family DNA or RNA helicase
MILNKTLTKQMLNELGIEGSGGSSSAGSGLMNPTMQLRKAANHPFLFGEPKDEQGRYLSDVNPKLLIMASGKLRLLDRMLVRLKRDGHKVLIFR